MPFAVWIELDDPDSTPSDEMVRAQRPQAILDLIESGGVDEVPEADAHPQDEDEALGLLDVRVLTHPRGARVGVVVDTEELDRSLGLGLDLARMLAGSPVLFGWRLTSVHSDRVTAPLEPGVGLPRLDEETARFPVFEHLPDELQQLAAQYLLVGAAASIVAPVGGHHRTVDAVEVVAGSAEHPWGRELAGALGGLLVAACRAETTQHPLVARGGGDAGLAEALLEVVRADAAETGTGFEDDRMRGFSLVEDFMSEHGLLWNRSDGELTPEADEAWSRRQLRSLLWAGVRVLATLGKDTLPAAETPWVWLAELDSDDIDDAVDGFAELDVEAFEEAAEHAEDELYAATQAHVLARLALLHPDLLDTKATAELMSGSSAYEPLHHLGMQILLSLGSARVEQVVRSSSGSVKAAAEQVLTVLRAVDSEDDDAYDDFHRVLEDLLPAVVKPSAARCSTTRVFLDLLDAAARAAGDEDAAKAARYLVDFPAELACVIVSVSDDDTVEQVLRRRVLAAVTALDPTAAGRYAADLPALRSCDPRDEPALRSEATGWWAAPRLSVVSSPSLVQAALEGCPEPGATLLRTLGPPEEVEGLSLAGLSTGKLVVAVVQAVSALSVAARDPELPNDILL
ncbi:hypothetical protein ABZ816_35810 [Actinosynnema sp. NPDC047251]|uniref:Uncharacterized protein n=1 Tax=Saccharothrix espanaensis (strain ATCC 51144 / DSM 44229 / JCM 9112 / NBRC 15066 / NRRL 15764) TaxID=1179773 RepID=K0JX39_SACES|nr:hypothetical protein [Saccharothrix espanaensis]CCH29344.1 hypothetical protein BN6_20220 [Saccharothrix espanaensis DSM 44229]